MAHIDPLAVILAAQSVSGESCYRLGDKVLIVRIAAMLETTVQELAPKLLAWHASGAITLARIDLVQAFDKIPNALKRSHIKAPGMTDAHGFHAIVA